jgi:multidrug efflux system outer membrane protein
VAVAAQAVALVERRRGQQEHALNVLLGQTPVAVPRGLSLSAAAAAIVPPDSISSTLLARRPDVLQADREYAAAVARTGAAQAARLPTFSIVGSYGTQSPNTSFLFSSAAEVYQLLGGISIPIFTGGKLENDAAAARARAEQARARYERTVLNALQDAGDALVAVRSSRDEVTASETSAAALRAALQLAQLRYQTGVSGYLEVLDVQRSLFEAEVLLSQAQLRQLTSAVQLYKALGGSWQETPAAGR